LFTEVAVKENKGIGDKSEEVEKLFISFLDHVWIKK